MDVFAVLTFLRLTSTVEGTFAIACPDNPARELLDRVYRSDPPRSSAVLVFWRNGYVQSKLKHLLLVVDLDDELQVRVGGGQVETTSQPRLAYLPRRRHFRVHQEARNDDAEFPGPGRIAG